MFEAGRTVVLGSGYVAGAYMRALNYLGLRPMSLSRSWIDYTDWHELKFFLKTHRPQLVINAAGYTGRTVDDCEINKAECFNANVQFVWNTGMICKSLGIPMIHISSGCIFNGPGPFIESDDPNNDGFYANCKAHAEYLLEETGVKAWMFRIRMPFNHLPHRRNWLVKLASYDKILDGMNSITFIDEFAIRSYQLAQKAEPGVYHSACSTPVSTLSVAQALLDAGVRTKPLKVYSEEDFKAAGHVARSAAVLDVSKFERAYGTQFGDPMVAIRWCIDRLREAGATSPNEETTLLHPGVRPGVHATGERQQHQRDLSRPQTGR